MFKEFDLRAHYVQYIKDNISGTLSHIVENQSHVQALLIRSFFFVYIQKGDPLPQLYRIKYNIPSMYFKMCTTWTIHIQHFI